MNSEINAIIDETAKRSDEELQQIINANIKTWVQDIRLWITQARGYILNSQSLIERLQLNQEIKRRSANKSFHIIEKLLRNRQLSAKQRQDSTILLRGYELLNLIGETIRNEKIKYSITVTTTGQAISASSVGEVYTFTIPYNEFINIITISSAEINLQSPRIIYDSLSTNKNIKEEDKEEWSEDKINEFKLYRDQVFGGKFDRYFKKSYGNINEGYLLEAFLRFRKNGYIVLRTKSKGYWKALFESVQITLKHPDIFFAGGDLEDLQIKGLQASVTNINSLLINLQEVLSLLIETQSGYETIKKYLKTEAQTQMENKIKKDINIITQELVSKFTSGISRTIKI